MITKTELEVWLESLPAGSLVAVDDGGLALVAITADGQTTDAYIEVGGVPEAAPRQIWPRPATNRLRWRAGH